MSTLNWSKVAYAVVFLWAATTIGLSAQTYTQLVSFDGTNGASPGYMSLVQGFDGNFYGTTYSGGSANAGTVFNITSGGILTTLYSFCTQAGCPDGSNPTVGLAQDANGNFYGTTSGGGAFGEGTVFEMTPDGTLTTLHNFCGPSSPRKCKGGFSPQGVVLATDGNLYGTTSGGWVQGNHGSVFKITPGGKVTGLHSFDEADGADPNPGLVQATSGNFYGTTEEGGQNGWGTVFEITPRGTLTTLYSFCPENLCADGEYPGAGLVQAADGNFYGTTVMGGNNGNGTVFEITADGNLTTLHNFVYYTDGADPTAGLVQGTDGNLYGTTSLGGALSGGTVFDITPAGTLTTLYTFCGMVGCSDGSSPAGVLMQATDGNFYGTTEQGGANHYGTVFSLSVGLAPFVETLPPRGNVGTNVVILGTNLTGTTAVTFNGTAAAFTIVSATEITTVVPTGATSGSVQVTTPTGTLTSNKKFIVKP